MHEGRWIEFNSNSFGWILFFILLIIVVVIIIISLLQRRNKENLAGLTDTQRTTLDNIEGQIMALISQYGDGITQSELRSHLDLPVDIVAQNLLKMEKAGSIKRTWINDDYTFRVNRVSN